MILCNFIIFCPYVAVHKFKQQFLSFIYLYQIAYADYDFCIYLALQLLA